MMRQLKCKVTIITPLIKSGTGFLNVLIILSIHDDSLNGLCLVHVFKSLIKKLLPTESKCIHNITEMEVMIIIKWVYQSTLTSKSITRLVFKK